jgi:hypothetical protein
MADESEDQQFFHSQNIAQRAAEYHGKGKTPEGGTEYPPDLFFRQVKFCTPYTFERSPEGKCHGSYDKRYPAGKKKPVRLKRGLHNGRIWLWVMKKAIAAAVSDTAVKCNFLFLKPD